jgi:hypothetical protein
MASYRVYFLNEGYRIGDSEDFDESSDAAAVALAKLLLGTRCAFKDFELWQESRAVRLFKRPEEWLDPTRATVSIGASRRNSSISSHQIQARLKIT